MRLMWVPAALLALSLVSAPAAAIGATIEFKSPAEAVMTVDYVVEGDNATDMRTYMDSESDFGGSAGNGDGTVQQNEVDAIENFFKGFLSMANESDSTPTGALTMDGKQPKDFSLKAFDIRDATGPVSSTSPITMHIEFSTTFDVQPGDRHTLRIEAQDDEGEDEDEEDFNFAGDYEVTQATLKAPNGYIIESAEGLPPGASVAGDKKSIRYDGIPAAEDQDTVIVFVRGGGGGAAGVGLAAALAGIAVVAAIAALARRK